MIRSRRFPVLAALAVLAGCVDGGTSPFDDSGHSLQFALVEPARISAEETNALGSAFDAVDEYDVTVVDALTLATIASVTVPITSGGTQHNLDIDVPTSAFGRDVTINLVAYANGMELYRSTLTITLSEQVGRVPVPLEIRYTGPGIRGRVLDTSGSGVGGATVELTQGGSPVATAVTEPDGTYLFVNLATQQSYTVTPVLPSGLSSLTVCPGSRDLTITTGDESLVADFRATAQTCTIDVLVLSGGDFDDTQQVASLLSSDPNLAVSTFFFVSQLPSDSLLNAHDVVLLFSNGLFDESSTLGSRLAQYVGLGGNVVTASFYWQSRSGSGVQGATGWGGLEQLDAMTSNGGANYSVGSLGSTSAHPLTAGVTVLVANSFWGGAALQAQATTVATWSDGSPMVAYRTLAAGQRMVGVSLFPAIGAGATGDVSALFLNAVNWAGAAGGPARN